METTKKQIENVKQSLEEKKIFTSDIALYQEGLQSEHYSIYVRLSNLNKEDLDTIFNAAHKFNLIAKLNKLYPSVEHEELIVEII